MNSSNARPKWWKLYLTVPLLITLFILDHRLTVSTRAHQVIQIGILLLVYGLVYGWLKANSVALSAMDRQKYYGKVRVIQLPALQGPQAKDERYPTLQLPNSEVKGMLSNTFEMNYIDAETLPIDEFSPNMDKE